MVRYRNNSDENRESAARSELFGRERPWNYDDPYARRSRSLGEYGTERYEYGTFGERADYESDEPRYTGEAARYAQDDYRRAEDRGRSPDEDRTHGIISEDLQKGGSLLRCCDIMTRELAVATRNTTLREVALMMKQANTGVIPVVEYDLTGDNGLEGQRNTESFRYGKLEGVITDRDIVIRAIAEDKDCTTTRAEDLMSTDIHTAQPNDRVVDIIRKMGHTQVRRIPVVGDDGALLGIMSLGDVALESTADRELANALEEISSSASVSTRKFE